LASRSLHDAFMVKVCADTYAAYVQPGGHLVPSGGRSRDAS